jgi:hypothetical protein
MGNKLIDITGQVFGTRTVLGLNRTDSRSSYWDVQCSCGAVSVVSRSCIQATSTCRSCASSKTNKRHGMSNTPLHRTWSAMIQRCTNPNTREYVRYGGRGISICEDWLVFENFMRDMGERPDGTSIDRIDNDGNYEPSNCRWATQKTQTNNRSVTRMITANSQTLPLTEWSALIGVKPITLEKRVKAGWSDHDVINTPIMTSQESGARSWEVRCSRSSTL